MDRSGFVAVAALIMVVLAALMFASPFLSPYGAYTGLDGNVGFIDHDWGANDLMYLLGDLFCHQEDSRCLHLNGSQLPFCLRDMGIMTGLAAGFVASYLIGPRMRDRRFAYAAVVLVLTTLAEWVAEGFVGDMPVPRTATGFMAGFGAALFLVWLLYKDGSDGQART